MKRLIILFILFIVYNSTYKLNAQEAEIKPDGIVFPILGMHPPSPVTGQVIYFTGTSPNEYQYYNGTSWESLASASGSAGISHLIQDFFDGDTRVVTQEFGTNDYIDMYTDDTLAVRIHKNPHDDLLIEPIANSNTFFGRRVGLVNSWQGSANSFYGYEAGESNAVGNSNTFIGYRAGNANISGSSNTMLGTNAGRNAPGTENTFVGTSAGRDASKNFNTFIGSGAGLVNNSEKSVAIGNNTLRSASGSGNAALGYDAGRSTTSGTQNVYMGLESGRNNTSGDGNLFIGSSAGYTNTSGEFNLFLGYDSGYLNANGKENVMIGQEAGYNVTGSRNVLIGNRAGRNDTNVSDQLIIHNDYIGANEIPLVSGDFSNEHVRVAEEMQVSGYQGSVIRLEDRAGSAFDMELDFDDGDLTFLGAANGSGSSLDELIKIDDKGFLQMVKRANLLPTECNQESEEGRLGFTSDSRLFICSDYNGSRSWRQVYP